MGQSADTIKALVTEGAACKKELNRLSDRLDSHTKIINDKKKPYAVRLDEINAQLVELGEGDYEGSKGEIAKVIAPAAALKPTTEEIEASRKILGKNFPTLIAENRSVVYTPNKSFRTIAEALLPAAVAAKVIKLFEKPSTPYVKWVN